AIIDEAHQLEDVATQYFGYAFSNYRIEEYARDVERFSASSAVSEPKDRDDLAKGVERLRDHSRSFFTELAFAHRTQGRLKSEERVRATDATLADARDAAANLAGALDRLEATLALQRVPPDEP